LLNKALYFLSALMEIAIFNPPNAEISRRNDGIATTLREAEQRLNVMKSTSNTGEISSATSISASAGG